jgi:regulator of sigma E protease
MTSISARQGFDSLLQFTAFISLNLGFFNLLPFPVLDGGHLVFLLIEGIRRRPLSVETKMVIQQVGMAFLLALRVFVIFNDIRRWPQIKDLFNF